MDNILDHVSYYRTWQNHSSHTHTHCHVRTHTHTHARWRTLFDLDKQICTRCELPERVQAVKFAVNLGEEVASLQLTAVHKDRASRMRHKCVPQRSQQSVHLVHLVKLRGTRPRTLHLSLNPDKLTEEKVVLSQS